MGKVGRGWVRGGGTRVAARTAVVGGGEDRHELALRKELVAVLYDLMRAADKVEVVLLQKLFHNTWPKGEGHATVVFSPLVHLLLGVAPEQIAEEAWGTEYKRQPICL
jgi:hypothetical protein